MIASFSQFLVSDGFFPFTPRLNSSASKFVNPLQRSMGPLGHLPTVDFNKPKCKGSNEGRLKSWNMQQFNQRGLQTSASLLEYSESSLIIPRISYRFLLPKTSPLSVNQSELRLWLTGVNKVCHKDFLKVTPAVWRKWLKKTATILGGGTWQKWCGWNTTSIYGKMHIDHAMMKYLEVQYIQKARYCKCWEHPLWYDPLRLTLRLSICYHNDPNHSICVG